jgi:predicted nucleic acid-binding protein
MPVIFDSNVWIGLFNKNDSCHQQALRLFSEHQSIGIPEYVVLEVVTVLQLRASKLKADLFAKIIKSTESVSVLCASDELFWTTLTIFQQQTKKLSFVDCTLIALSKYYRVYTFDDELEKQLAINNFNP